MFRNYPLPFHEHAQKAAEAGHCAHEQGKFWEMHDHMFGHQDQLAVPDLKKAARELWMDGGKFDACLDGGKFAKDIKGEFEAGQEAGVNGTPAFFVNGQLISGAQPFDEFKKLIDRELASAK